MAQIKKNFVEDLPVAIGNMEQESSIIGYVDEMLKLCQGRYNQIQSFVKYCNSAYEPKAITEKLECFYCLSFKEFCEELKKQKVKLSASAQMDLLPLFDQEVQKVASFTAQIKELQSQLDDEVFAIYGIDSATADRIRSEMVIEI